MGKPKKGVIYPSTLDYIVSKPVVKPSKGASQYFINTPFLSLSFLHWWLILNNDLKKLWMITHEIINLCIKQNNPKQITKPHDSPHQHWQVQPGSDLISASLYVRSSSTPLSSIRGHGSSRNLPSSCHVQVCLLGTRPIAGTIESQIYQNELPTLVVLLLVSGLHYFF